MGCDSVREFTHPEAVNYIAARQREYEVLLQAQNAANAAQAQAAGQPPPDPVGEPWNQEMSNQAFQAFLADQRAR